MRRHGLPCPARPQPSSSGSDVPETARFKQYWGSSMGLSGSGRVNGIHHLPASAKETLVAIGNFDGVHLGHQSVIRSSLDLARRQALTLVVLTFHPHPLDILGGHPRHVLTPIDRKVELLAQLDPSLLVVVEPFTQQLSALSPERFVAEALVKALRAKMVIVGHNFRFGRGRSGDLHTLRDLGAKWGVEARSVDLVTDGTQPLSSTRIREAVLAGEVASAARMLGRPHAITGTVIEGNRRGRTMGFPTANLDSICELLPSHGVYAGWVDRLDGQGRPHRLAGAMANIGVRPTLAAGPSVEAHLLDFDADLYGQRLRLHLVQRLRAEQRFESLDALTAQLHQDRETTRAVLAGQAP